jgi:hypothetical protein
VFYGIASQRRLIPAGLPRTKKAVRAYLRSQGSEDAWTELQGEAYGPGMAAARLFDGAAEFLRACREHGAALFIVSHRTRRPFLGPPYDLHASAWSWLEQQGVAGGSGALLERSRVFLQATREEKVARIAALGCSHFIDDLGELFTEPGFPAATAAFLFDPDNEHGDGATWTRVGSWPSIQQLLLSGRRQGAL